MKVNQISSSSRSHLFMFICLLSCLPPALSSGKEEWEFRLAGGQTQLSGRVEMRPNSKSAWGTICIDEVFKATQYAAIAACNSAGLVGVNQSIMISPLAGSASQPIYITNVLCSAENQFLQNCSTSALYSVGQCIHSEDVTISCTPPPQFWKFRLTNGTSPGNGILMMQPMPSLPWGTVYYYYIVYDYQTQDSRLKQIFFCEEVGFPLNETKDGRAITNQAQRLYQRNNYYPYDLPSYYYIFGCNPGTTNVRGCTYNTIGTTTWSYSEHLWLDCRPPQSKQELLTEIKIDERWSPLGWRSGMGSFAARKNSTDSWGNIPAVSIFPFSYSVSPYSYNVLTTNQTNTLKLLCAAAGFPNANTPAAMTYPTTYYYTPDYYLYWYTDDISCPLDATSFAVDCLAQIDHQGAYTRSGSPLGVDCYPEVERPSEWEFRLVNGNTNSSGIVNMRPNSTAPWALIGYDGDLGYNLIGWVAVCRSLGFNSSVDDYAAGRPFALRRDFCAYGCSTVYNKWLQAVGGCTLWDKPQYTSIQNCTSRWRLGAFSSNSYDGIVIDCMSHPYDPSQWEFRLVGGTRPGMGKLEWRPWPELDWGLLGNQYQSTLNSLDQLFRALSICRSLGFLNVTNPDFLPVGNVNYTQEVYSYGINCRIDNTYVQNCSQVYPLRTPQVGSASYTYWIDCYSPNIFKAEWMFENGGTPWRGRLLYRFSNYAPFGTVCNDYFKHNHFSWNAACHSAGYTNVTGARYLPMGPGSGEIYLDDIQCLATNFYIEDCKKADLGVTNCFHGQDAGVDCYPPPDELWRWEFRLTDGSKPTNGRLEMRPTSVSTWGTVCSDIFNHTYLAWMAACRTVGYPKVERAAWRYNGMGPELIYLDKIDCRNNDTSNKTILTNCSGYPIGSYDCTPWDAAGVDCGPEPERPKDWQFALAGGTAATNGRVMMRPTPSTPWGTVCKRGLTSVLNLTMICLSLGFSATTRPVLRNFGRGTTPMYLDEGSCGQGAHFLNNCTFAPLFSHDCLGADEALALDCYPTMTETLTATITHSNLVNVTPTVNTATRSLEATESALMNKTKSVEPSRTSSLSFTEVDSKSAAVNNTKTKLPTVTATITLKSPMPEETKTVLARTLSHEPTISEVRIPSSTSLLRSRLSSNTAYLSLTQTLTTTPTSTWRTAQTVSLSMTATSISVNTTTSATAAVINSPSSGVPNTRSLSQTQHQCLNCSALCTMVHLYIAAATRKATCDNSFIKFSPPFSAIPAGVAFNNQSLFVSLSSSLAPGNIYNFTDIATYRLLSIVASYEQSKNAVTLQASSFSNETKVLGIRAFRNFTTVIDVAIKILSLQYDEAIDKEIVMASGINVTFTESCEWPANGSSYSRIVAIERPLAYLPRMLFDRSTTNANVASVNAAISLSVGAFALPIAAIQQGVALSLVRMAQCDGDSLDGTLLDPSVHPLRFGIGDGMTKYARGAVLGNLLIFPCVWAVIWFLGVSHTVAAWRKHSLAFSREFVGWPGVAITPFSILSEGSAMTCVALLFNASNSILDAVLGGVGLALLLASILSWLRSVWLLSNLKSRSLECRPLQSVGLLRFFKPRYEWELTSRNKALADVDLLLPSSVAKQEASESDAIAATYLQGRLPFLGDSWWMWSQVAASILSVAVGVAEGVSLSDASQCKSRWVFASAAAILQGLVVLTSTVVAEVVLLGIVGLCTLSMIITISLSTFGATEFSGGTFDALNAFGIANSAVGILLMIVGTGVSLLEANTKLNKKGMATSIQSTTLASFWGSSQIDTMLTDQELAQVPTLLIESKSQEMQWEEAHPTPRLPERELEKDDSKSNHSNTGNNRVSL